MVPDRLWTNPSLQPFDLKVWCALQFFARDRGCCEPTDAALARETSASEQTVRRSLQRLEKAAFLSRELDGRTRVITLRPEGDGAAIPAYALRIASA